MKRIFFVALIGLLFLTGCGNRPAQATPPPATPTTLVFPTSTTAPLPAQDSAFTPLPNADTTSAPPAASSFCTDPKVTALIDSLKTSMLNADGALLGSLVSPQGMEVRYFRDGNAIKYTPDQAKFLFETTYEADWGAAPGSGIEKKGPFHDVVVPDLVKVFQQPYTLYCNELKHGGATYEVKWPYTGDFYAIYFAGTDQNGGLDWHTWAVGVEYSGGRPVIYALVNFFWEP